MKYSELTRLYFESTPAVGVLGSDEEGAASGLFRGSAGRQERGIWVQFDIRVADGRIIDARFLSFGCPHTIAAASWVAERAGGSVVRRELPESVQALQARFEVPPEKLGKLLIVEDAWRAAASAAIDS